MNTVYLNPENIRPAEWRTNYILAPDLKLLRKSISDYGWIYPIIVRKDDMTIIDGFARWLLASNDKSVAAKGKIPVVIIDCDEANAIIMHIRMNRARGSIVTKYLSHAIEKLKTLGYVDPDHVTDLLGMTNDEYDILSETRFIKAKKLASHEYSRAWIPIEVASDATTGVAGSYPEMKFERPPNPDA